MASLAFPKLAKTATLSDGTVYGYVAVAASSSQKPTFLLLHGYPSSSYDWRYQIASLSAAGFGVIVPDLLGYGDTDAPDDVGAYRMKIMSKHMADILDQEGIPRCIAVGHDWGSGLLSRLTTYMTDRLLGAVFVSVGYLEPGLKLLSKRAVRPSVTIFMVTGSGITQRKQSKTARITTSPNPPDLDTNHDVQKPASEFSLLYPADPEDWKKYFAPVGKAADFVRTGQVQPLPSWYNLTEYTMRDRIMAIKGYRGPLNWYKAGIRGVNIPDEAPIPDKARYCTVPTLLVTGEFDFVTRADAMGAKTKEWVKGDLRVETLDCGHWVQLERPDKLQKLFEEFAQQVVAKEA
nr:isoform 2 of bifunctional epoxide hydrolase 2 [Quercus suber]